VHKKSRYDRKQGQRYDLAMTMEGMRKIMKIMLAGICNWNLPSMKLHVKL
jgi:hypothetical protein